MEIKKCQLCEHLLVGSVSSEFLSDTGELASGELVHAAVVHVVHEVRGWVVASIIGARVHNAGAAVVGLLLSWGVGNAITTANLAAATLEGVVQTHPMANLVGAGVAFVVVGSRSTRERCVKDHNTIHAGGRLVVLGEGSPAQKTPTDVGGVKVKGIGSSLAEGRLHRLLNGSTGLNREPIVVGGGVRAGQLEGPALGTVGVVQDGDLRCNLRAVQCTNTLGVGDDVDVHGNLILGHHGGSAEELGLPVRLSSVELLLSQINNTASSKAIGIMVTMGEGDGKECQNEDKI